MLRLDDPKEQINDGSKGTSLNTEASSINFRVISFFSEMLGSRRRKTCPMLSNFHRISKM